MIARILDSEPIILIGPLKVGKTTIGKLLAKRLSCSYVSLDNLERSYTETVGFDGDIAATIQAHQGDLAWYTYRRQFFDEAVVQFLAEHNSGVLELGGGHPILPNEEKQSRVNRALEPFGKVILLLPTSDIQESLHILKSRQKAEYLNPDLNEEFLKDNRFLELAKFTFYTEGKSPDETCDDIISRLRLPSL